MNPIALWTAAEAATATGGTGTADWRGGGISIDSRTTQRDDLFIALRGPRFDGHDFVAAAFCAGAAVAVVSRTPERLPVGAPLLVVDDTMAALNALARKARERSPARIAAVTGSVGKTGTKEALRIAISAQGLPSASAASQAWRRRPALRSTSSCTLAARGPGSLSTRPTTPSGETTAESRRTPSRVPRSMVTVLK